MPTERLFHAEERVTVHGQSGEAPGSAGAAAGFLGRPEGWALPARGGAKVHSSKFLDFKFPSSSIFPFASYMISQLLLTQLVKKQLALFSQLL